MRRLRVLRIVLPVALVGFLIAVALTLKARPPRGPAAADASAGQDNRMEGFRFSDFLEGRRRLLVQAKVGRVDEQGAFSVEDVQRFELDRESQGPLLMTASRGAGSGAQGKRIVRLEGGVTLKDGDAGIDLDIPTVEIDQVAGVVRSVGEVRLRNASWTGSASEVVYSLKGEPTVASDLTLDGPDGGHLVARRVVVPPSSRLLTLTGDVVARQKGMTLRADNVAVERRADGRVANVTATPAVSGSAPGLGGGLAEFAAREVHASWNDQGTVSAVSLEGNAHATHTRGTIAADRIEAKTVDASGTVAFAAQGQVVASGPTPRGSAQLSCDALSATIDPRGGVRDGVATGNVRFDGEGTAGEAAEGHVTSFEPSGVVTLKSSGERRARLASGRTRIVAETIVTDQRGVKLAATGRVESTLLPVPGAKSSHASPMFTGEEAVHFVSASLDSENTGARLVFKGDVRGWQGERTLSADEVEIIQNGDVLNASGHVASRMPRESTRAATEADFVQVGADRLSYRGGAHNAQYDGHVRIRQAEGWLQAPRVVAILAEGGPGLREVQALDGVRFEYRTPGDKGVPTTATGEGDRATYDPVARVLRVYGDTGPATVRSTGPKGGVTVGRVLRYDVDTGALEVESGDRDRATIRTPKD
jgi:lipopolysaccharide export system protein LptA